LEYANTISEIDGAAANFEQAANLCYENSDVINAMTTFNNHFEYGIKLTQEEFCPNEECPNNNAVDKLTGQVSPRRSLFHFPLQPNLFAISYSQEEATKQYFDLQQSPTPTP